MARQAALRKLVIEPPASGESLKVPAFGGGPPAASGEPVVSNARLGLLMLLAAEAMLFAGLIGAYLVFRLGSSVWPPPFQPRLPTAVTGVNTLVLIGSGLTMRLALRAIRLDNGAGLVRRLWETLFLGGLFLAIQGFEWVRLIRFGLTMSSGVYGATFYTLIGCHGLHVLAAVLWLGIVQLQARRGRYTRRQHTGVEICAMYWTFVVALWPMLYGLVYLY
jgi:heme/copper-type cytochrome/quinol oxidase subunit 3